jgi:hypothetical protein
MDWIRQGLAKHSSVIPNIKRIGIDTALCNGRIKNVSIDKVAEAMWEYLRLQAS